MIKRFVIGNEQISTSFKNTKIETDRLGLRPCRVFRKYPRKEMLVINAYFHKWFEGTIDFVNNGLGMQPVNKIKCIKALVEYEDGSMDEYHYKDVQFTDRGGKL